MIDLLFIVSCHMLSHAAAGARERKASQSLTSDRLADSISWTDQALHLMTDRETPTTEEAEALSFASRPLLVHAQSCRTKSIMSYRRMPGRQGPARTLGIQSLGPAFFSIQSLSLLGLRRMLIRQFSSGPPTMPLPVASRSCRRMP